jgi:hypothetical protein
MFDLCFMVAKLGVPLEELTTFSVDSHNAVFYRNSSSSV